MMDQDGNIRSTCQAKKRGYYKQFQLAIDQPDMALLRIIILVMDSMCVRALSSLTDER